MAEKKSKAPSDIPEIAGVFTPEDAAKPFKTMMEARPPELGSPINAPEGDNLPGNGLVQASGDVLVGLLVREAYVEALRSEARLQGQNLSKHLQGLLDWWVEQEFAQIARR